MPSLQARHSLPIDAQRVDPPHASAPQGPSFTLIEETTWDALKRSGRQWPFAHPVLVKGGVKHWPAYSKWTFDYLASACEGQGAHLDHPGEKGAKKGVAEAVKFTDGLVEQGQTKGRPLLPVAPYLRALERAALQLPDAAAGLLSAARLAHIRAAPPGQQRFHLNWAHMQSFRPTTLYLAQWDMLQTFPALRHDLAIKSLWPDASPLQKRLTWEYVFLGPANTLTGLHNDFPHNWFCQFKGVKEFMLFAPDQSQHLHAAKKYDWGATLSDIDVSRLHEPGPQQSALLADFEKAQGIYARVEAGDALFIPKRHWHSVVSSEPSISLGMFGLTPWEVATGGTYATLRDWAHHARLYRWGNCTCHPA